MSSPLILREGEAPKPVQLPADIALALAASRVVQVVRTERVDWWEVSTQKHIGVVNVGGQQIVIEPKVEMNHLVFLMGYARNPAFWRDDRVCLDADSNLPEALADAFLRLTKTAVAQGLLKGYRAVEESLPVLRGRIREADQLRRRWGRNLPLEIRYDEFTVDIPENQLLLAAVVRLLRTPGLGSRHRAALHRVRTQFADVALLTAGALPTWAPTRLNVRYQPALELADLILKGRSFEQRVGGLLVTGYLFNMATIFEDFVVVALAEALKPYGGRTRRYDTYLDEAEQVRMKPDFVWLVDDRPVIVADAKYKAEKPSGLPNADLYQLLAYCTVLGLDSGHLVYAKGNADAREHVVSGSGTRLIAHALDLTLAPIDLLATVRELARRLVGESRMIRGEPPTSRLPELSASARVRYSDLLDRLGSSGSVEVPFGGDS